MATVHCRHLVAGLVLGAGLSPARAVEPSETASADLVFGASAPEPAAPPASEAAPAPAAQEAGPNTGRLHFNLGVDITNRYFFRGIVQDRDGFLTQPYASIAFDLIKQDWTLQAVIGTWNSFHDTAPLATTTNDFVRKWYEADLYAGLAVTAGEWSGKAIYTFYTSPSGSFSTVQDVTLGAAYDDTALLGAFALHPALAIIFETGSNFADGADTRRGVYLEPSIAPGFTLEDGVGGVLKGTAITFPVVLGLSLSDYYENATGDDETFGYVSVGAKAVVPLGLPKDWGAWSFSTGVQGLFLGNHTKGYNGGRGEEVIWTFGLSISY